MFPVSEICLRFPKYVYGFRNIFDVSRCRESPGGPPSVAGGAPGDGCQLSRSGDRKRPNCTFWGPPAEKGRISVYFDTSPNLSLLFFNTSVVPAPDGAETRDMCPREYLLFPVFQRFPQYYGFRNMFTVSEICLRFPKYVYGFRNMFTVSEIYLTYPGVGCLASCHAPVTQLCRESAGGPQPRVPVVTLL
jgi:hypothetical protein